MKSSEAYKILNVNSSISNDELKQKYKELAKQYHPDIYKEDPDKFKKINEAYQAIKTERENPSPQYSGGPFAATSWGGTINLDEIFGTEFGKNSSGEKAKRYHAPPIDLSINISFKESVLGSEQKISYQRTTKCGGCNGKGIERKGNGCDNCNGFGQIVSQSKNMQFTKACTKCSGRDIKINDCISCKTTGIKSDEVTGNIHIPAGVKTGDKMCMTQRGNFAGSNGIFGDRYSDVFIKITVEKIDGLELVNENVVSKIDLSLYEALIGCEKQIKTILGDKTITIPKMSRNGEELYLDGLGIKDRQGKQIIIMNVNYPNDKTKLNKIIDILSHMENENVN